MRSIISVLVLVLLAMSCGSKQEKEIRPVDVELPSELQEVLEAHGGLEVWKEQRALTYTMKRTDREEKHQIDLQNRKVHLEGKGWTIGFDGKEVWVSPDKAAYSGSSARFYHNLIFYFYAMPFVLADPGIHYEILEPAEIQGKLYNKISITYDNEVGDAPDDEYILCYDPESKRMEWLLYTVTYFTNEPGDKYNALHYKEWQEVNGLLLPEQMIGYRTSGDTITEKRYESLFEMVELSTEPFDQGIFEIPQEAEIDSLK